MTRKSELSPEQNERRARQFQTETILTTAYPNHMPIPKGLKEDMLECSPDRWKTLNNAASLIMTQRYEARITAEEITKRAKSLREVIDKWLEETLRQEMLKDATGRN